MKFEQLERFSIVVTRGIKHEYKWWPIAELGYRYVYVVAVVLAPGFVVRFELGSIKLLLNVKSTYY